MSAPTLVVVAGAALAIALPIVTASTSLEARQRAAGAADAAALAAADAVLGWAQGDPCGLADSIAASAGVDLEQCEIDWAKSQVRIAIGVQTIFGTVHTRARAGPPVS